jgi:hypothetical protein
MFEHNTVTTILPLQWPFLSSSSSLSSFLVLSYVALIFRDGSTKLGLHVHMNIYVHCSVHAYIDHEDVCVSPAYIWAVWRNCHLILL